MLLFFGWEKGFRRALKIAQNHKWTRRNVPEQALKRSQHMMIVYEKCEKRKRFFLWFYACAVHHLVLQDDSVLFMFILTVKEEFRSSYSQQTFLFVKKLKIELNFKKFFFQHKYQHWSTWNLIFQQHSTKLNETLRATVLVHAACETTKFL